jgi:membrane associated rhomboid family serine protease
MFPIRDNIRSLKKPYVTKAIVIINAIVFLFQILLPDAARRALIFEYGFIPNRFTNSILEGHLNIKYLYPFATSMFLHGSLVHLIGNLWIFWIFGDNVEDRLGHFKFALFYILSGIAAMLCHYLVDPGSLVPAIGASGAIAGVMGAYFVMFPYSRIITFVPVIFIPLFIRVPAVIYLGIWFILQVYSGSLNSLMGGAGGGVAWWAHIGGFLCGILLLKPMYKSKYRQPVYYDYDNTNRRRW